MVLFSSISGETTGKISRKIRYRLVFKGVSVRNVLGFAYDGGGTVKIGDVGVAPSLSSHLSSSLQLQLSSQLTEVELGPLFWY